MSRISTEWILCYNLEYTDKEEAKIYEFLI
jgi:hypothetical protein